jgi:hypothetical protein
MNRAIWLAAEEAGFSRIARGQYAIIRQAFVLMNRTIWLAADEAGFPRIAHGQYAIFTALRSCDESWFSSGKKVSKSLSNYSKRKKIDLKLSKGAIALLNSRTFSWASFKDV